MDLSKRHCIGESYWKQLCMAGIIDDVRKVEEKYQKRALLIYAALVACFFVCFGVYLQQQVKLRSNPQTVIGTLPDQHFDAPNLIMCYPKRDSSSWLGVGYVAPALGFNGTANARGTNFMDWFEVLPNDLPWFEGINFMSMQWGDCLFVNSATTVDTERSVIFTTKNDRLVLLLWVGIVVREPPVQAVNVGLNRALLFALTDKSRDEVVRAKRLEEFEQGFQYFMSEMYTGDINVTDTWQAIYLSLVRRKQLDSRTKLFPRTLPLNEYDMKVEPWQTFYSSYPPLNVTQSFPHLLYPAILPEDRPSWRAHAADSDYVTAYIRNHTIPDAKAAFTRDDGSRVLYFQIGLHHKLPVTTREDVDPVQLSDLVSSLGGAWSVLIAIFGLFFMSTDWGTRTPVDVLKRSWWKRVAMPWKPAPPQRLDDDDEVAAFDADITRRLSQRQLGCVRSSSSRRVVMSCGGEAKSSGGMMDHHDRGGGSNDDGEGGDIEEGKAKATQTGARSESGTSSTNTASNKNRQLWQRQQQQENTHRGGGLHFRDVVLSASSADHRKRNNRSTSECAVAGGTRPPTRLQRAVSKVISATTASGEFRPEPGFNFDSLGHRLKRILPDVQARLRCLEEEMEDVQENWRPQACVCCGGGGGVGVDGSNYAGSSAYASTKTQRDVSMSTSRLGTGARTPQAEAQDDHIQQQQCA